jgi:hypothetical protein
MTEQKIYEIPIKQITISDDNVRRKIQEQSRSIIHNPP